MDDSRATLLPELVRGPPAMAPRQRAPAGRLWAKDRHPRQDRRGTSRGAEWQQQSQWNRLGGPPPEAGLGAGKLVWGNEEFDSLVQFAKQTEMRQVLTLAQGEPPVHERKHAPNTLFGSVVTALSGHNKY